MSINVLVVDDSAYFRRLLTTFIETQPDLKVVGSAENGQAAVELVARLRPHVVTMDVMMPVMDGIEAVKQIMSRTPTPILMFSASTTDGAQATLSALEAGAADFMPKRLAEIATANEDAKAVFCARIRALGEKYRSASRATLTPLASTQSTPQATPVPTGARDQSIALAQVKLVVIGASTGGPMALQEVLTALPASFPVPVLVVQHMPAAFTLAFAERLDRVCRIPVKEAADGDLLQNGHAYVAPGGKQMLLQRSLGSGRIRIAESDPGHTYRPCIDATLFSVAAEIGAQVLTVILTGMGSDGCAGAKVLKRSGGLVWSQDEASCVVYGMPMAIARAGLADRILPLNQVGPCLAKGVA